jgi:antitoxin component YwqK of YwqJK toxin-antitoxin module
VVRKNYKDGKEDGFCETWHLNGKLWQEFWYKNGKFDGLYKEWYENGNLKKEINYKDGEVIDSKYFKRN